MSLWYPFGFALSADHVRTVLIFAFFCKFPLGLINLRPDRSNSQRLTGSYNLMMFRDVSLSQERDECSEEIIQMRALQEKYEAEMSQLAKDSQVVSSFT